MFCSAERLIYIWGWPTAALVILYTAIIYRINRFYHIGTCAELYSAATGIEVTASDLVNAADRVWTLQRTLNAREGFTRAEDTFPEMWFKPIRMGSEEFPLFDYNKTKVLTENDLKLMLDSYYEERGWDISSGVPREARLI